GIGTHVERGVRVILGRSKGLIIVQDEWALGKGAQERYLHVGFEVGPVTSDFERDSGFLSGSDSDIVQTGGQRIRRFFTNSEDESAVEPANRRDVGLRHRPGD